MSPKFTKHGEQRVKDTVALPSKSIIDVVRDRQRFSMAHHGQTWHKGGLSVWGINFYFFEGGAIC
ncbi:MAG: hypothetical protein LBC85_07705 [Fibromonadaceae bacterium]|nr:hypothetical protein [Fibromonadaceae bacterium]